MEPWNFHEKQKRARHCESPKGTTVEKLKVLGGTEVVNPHGNVVFWNGHGNSMPDYP